MRVHRDGEGENIPHVGIGYHAADWDAAGSSGNTSKRTTILLHFRSLELTDAFSTPVLRAHSCRRRPISRSA